MVVQTRQTTAIKKPTKIIFVSSDDDEDYTPPSTSESECKEEYETDSTTEDITTTDDNTTTTDDDEEDEKLPFTSKIIPFLKDKLKVLESEEFIKYFDKIGELDPEIESVLKSSDVKEKYKIRLCELYCILTSQNPYSLEWIEMRNMIKQEIKQIKKKTCMFENVDRVQLAVKLNEFKQAKETRHVPIKEQIILLDASIDAKGILYNKYKELQEYDYTDSDEYMKIHTWLQHALRIPYNRIKTINTENIVHFLNNVYTKLNQEFYGMQKVKEQILLYINMKLTNPNAKGYNLALLGDKGVGKCFAKDTKILMYNGTIKNVQDVKLYESLIAPNNRQVIVKKTITHIDVMYTVTQPWAENYKVCKGHLLTLRCDKNINKFYTYFYDIKAYKAGDVVNIPVEVFYSYNKHLQNKFSAIQTPIHFNNGIDIDIPLYLLGMWYGGCNPNTVEFVITKNTDIFNQFKWYCKQYNCIYSVVYHVDSLMNITLETKHPNSFMNALKDAHLWGEYRIPTKFKSMSLDQKLQFIGGFIDAIGVVEYNNNIITCLVLGGNKEYINDLIFFIRSAGLYCKQISNRTIEIFGSSIALSRIQSKLYNRQYNPNLYTNHHITVIREDVEQYYGFEVDSDDHLFLLADCTVVHNCFAPDTIIRMFNGKTKAVQHIVSGDVLMGDDNGPRKVESITNGTETMYTVIQEQGKAYTVNESHILSLALKKQVVIDRNTVRTFYVVGSTILYIDEEGRDSSFDDIVYYIDMTVTEYLQYGEYIRPFLKGYKKGFEIKNSQLSTTHMFILGLLYKYPKYINVPNEYISFLEKISIANYYQKYRKETDYTIYERIVEHLHVDFNIHEILLTDREHQYQFLAGLLISAIQIYPKDEMSCYPLYIKHSLDYERVYSIIGIDKDALNIQCISLLLSNTYIPSPLMYDIQVIKKPEGEYYGFTLSPTSPNRRFLLQDGTVVHNTHISRTLADILDFPFEQISMGNVVNPEILTGHQSTYIGSKPGIIATTLIKMKYKNGIIFLDEFDKIKNTDVSNSMLHIVDSVQNSTFTDNYFGQELKIDLSNIWFVLAMNQIPECGPLRDRLFIIHLDGYKHYDKIQITINHLLKRVCTNVGLKETDIVIDQDTASYFINKISIGENKNNTGVRYIEKALTDFVNKIVFTVNTLSTFGDLTFSIHEKLVYPVVVTNHLIDKFVNIDTDSTVNMMYI